MITRLAYIVAGAAFLTMVAAPATAKSNHRHDGYGRHHQIYKHHGKKAKRYADSGWANSDRYRSYRRYNGTRYSSYYYPRNSAYYYRRYSTYAYPQNYGYYGGYYGGYGGYYPSYSNYYPRYYRQNRYRYRDRCGDGATGALIGGVAGALIGREIDRSDGRRYYRYRRDDGTTGLIIGGAIGAVVGHELADDC